MKTPFHIENKDSVIYSEIVIFNPIFFLEQLSDREVDKLEYDSIKTVSITKLLKKENLIGFNLDGFEKINFYLIGGNKPFPTERYNYEINRNPNLILDNMSNTLYTKLQKRYEYGINLLLHGDYIAKYIKKDNFYLGSDKYGIAHILNYIDFDAPKEYNPVPTFKVTPWQKR